MSNPKTPGVYIQEVPSFPPSVAAVETAIPVFIGYTEKAVDEREESLTLVPKKLGSMLEYEQFFGKPAPEVNTNVHIREANGALQSLRVDLGTPSNYKMHYALQFFFENGGGDCYIISVGDYAAAAGLIQVADLSAGLTESSKVDEITLILFPDALNLPSSQDYYDLYKAALVECADLQDRFTVMDVYQDAAFPPGSDANVDALRNGSLGSDINELKYGAVYYPNCSTSLDYYFGVPNDRDANVNIVVDAGDGSLAGMLGDLKGKNNTIYNQALVGLTQAPLVLAPSSGVVGVYAATDSNRGVWKAPANVNLNRVIAPTIKITDKDQESLNVDVTGGKSINAIRSFTGRGPAMIWGSRTLAGNDNEWRYVPVRRFFNMVEESVKKATARFVFEPNDSNTWTLVKAMIENFLVLQWRAGALQGASPEQAFFVRVGLGETMTALDILEGRMIVEIGMAVVRPAEFIILRFSHKMPEA